MATKALNPQRRKLIKGLAAGKTGKQAAIDAGYSPRSAESLASRISKEPAVKSAMEKLMDKVGLSDSKVFKAHADLIAANKTVSAISGKDANAGTVDFVDVPDWQARAKGIDMAHKIKGRYIEKKEISGPDGGAIPVQFTVKFVGE